MYKSFVILSIILIITAVVIYCDKSENEKVIVTIPELGSLTGGVTKTAWSEQIIFQFLNIPYAESPSKELRFKRPVPRKSWSNVKDVSKYGRRCPVITTIATLTNEELKEDLEDCLSLSVFSKNLTGNHPVMVYIHGGGFYNGSASDHPPNYLLEKDVVLVVVQYRIGILGFLSTYTKEIPGNVGVLDTVLALEWIKKNIHYFGGNSNCVTIFGQSAGAAIVSLLTISPIVPNNLFHRAIIQSGSILAPWAIDKDPIGKARFTCQLVGCSDCLNINAINKCLMGMPIADMLKKLLIKPNPSLILKDINGILPDTPKSLLLNMTSRDKYSIMAGATTHDGSYVYAVVYDGVKSKYGDINLIKPKQLLEYMVQRFSDDDTSGILENLIMKLIFKSGELNTSNHACLIPNFIDFSSIVAFKSPALHNIDLNSRNNQHSNYLYSFDYQGEHTRFGYEEGNEHYPFNGGVHHSDDNIYLFPYPTSNLNGKDRKIAMSMVELWTSFATNGQPAVENGPEILPVGADGTGPYFKINEEVSIGKDFLDEFLAALNDPNKNKLIRNEF